MGRTFAGVLVGLAITLVLLGAAWQSPPPRTLPVEITNPPAAQPLPNPIQPVSGTKTELTGVGEKHVPRLKLLDPNKLNDLQKQMLFSTQRATVWLARMHGTNGRFVPGWNPALKAPLEADHYLHQVEAAFAMARAARFGGEPQLTALALQTILSLLDETQFDEQSGARFTPMPSVAINRLGAAGLLVAAINELPDPKADLLTKSEQLCVYLRTQTRPEGWLSFTDAPPDRVPGNSEEMQLYPGMALYGLQLSQRHKPAGWKVDVLKKAVAFYLPWWRSNKSLGFVQWHTAAYTEAYLTSRDPVFASAVVEMNDWLAGMQYSRLDPRHPAWYGGFQGYADGRTIETAPTMASSGYAESLAEASRVARAQGDLTRFGRYAESLERSLQFLMTLQYTDAGTQHFSDWYRIRLVGGFHASLTDGNLRIDATAQGLTALIQCLDHVVLR